VFFYTAGWLYLFLKNTVYYTSSVAKIDFCQSLLDQYSGVPCLLDMDLNSGQGLPVNLLMSKLFFLQATPPDSANTAWTKQTIFPITFVLNPPGEDEIMNVSVFYSVFLHP
jgi:hypothetical protein